MVAKSTKETIYVDVDDEITTIIDKIQTSDSKILALVLPKRASVFQSIVNMRLLKRTAANHKKNIVLITSDASVLPLAGIVGLHVAKTLQSKPIIPVAPKTSDAPVALDDGDIDTIESEPTIDTSASIGKLAGLPAKDEEEAIEIDNTPEPPKAQAKSSKPKVNKKLKVPDFNNFRNRMIIGIVVLVVLVGGWVLANVVLPKSEVVIKTNTTDIATEVQVTTSPAYNEFDQEQGLIPGIKKELKKSDSKKVAATGQKDVGTKAEGKMVFRTSTNCFTPVSDVAAGTTVSADGLNFITDKKATFGSPVIEDGQCVFTSNTVNVVAEKAGAQYNLAQKSYTVSGRSSVTGNGSDMTGGTSEVIKIVSQEDIDKARQELIDSFNASAQQELRAQLEGEGYFPINDSLTAGEPLVVANPVVDTEANELVVNVTTSFTMVGAKRDNLVTLLEAAITEKIDQNTQTILNNGLDDAAVRIDQRRDDGQHSFLLSVVAQAGVEQNEDEIKQAIAGMKKNEAESTLKERPGITDVSVTYSPFWVTKVPSNKAKVTLVFEQQDTASGADE